jgi:hypothetical protein
LLQPSMTELRMLTLLLLLLNDMAQHLATISIPLVACTTHLPLAVGKSVESAIDGVHILLLLSLTEGVIPQLMEHRCLSPRCPHASISNVG